MIKQHYREEEKQKDLMMQIERLKAIKAMQEVERAHKIRLKRDHE